MWAHVRRPFYQLRNTAQTLAGLKYSRMASEEEPYAGCCSLLSVFLTVLTVTSGEETHYSEGEGHFLRGGRVPPFFRSSWL